MKIAKSRLLQIIREEVELHEKNTFELDESFLEELSDKQEKKAIDDEVASDEEAGNLHDIELEEYDVEEDQIIKHGTKDKVVPVTKVK